MKVPSLLDSTGWVVEGPIPSALWSDLHKHMISLQLYFWWVAILKRFSSNDLGGQGTCHHEREDQRAEAQVGGPVGQT